VIQHGSVGWVLLCTTGITDEHVLLADFGLVRVRTPKSPFCDEQNLIAGFHICVRHERALDTAAFEKVQHLKVDARLSTRKTGFFAKSPMPTGKNKVDVE
jgi:hypothetical protein